MLVQLRRYGGGQNHQSVRIWKITKFNINILKSQRPETFPLLHRFLLSAAARNSNWGLLRVEEAPAFLKHQTKQNKTSERFWNHPFSIISSHPRSGHDFPSVLYRREKGLIAMSRHRSLVRCTYSTVPIFLGLLHGRERERRTVPWAAYYPRVLRKANQNTTTRLGYCCCRIEDLTDQNLPRAVVGRSRKKLSIIWS